MPVYEYRCSDCGTVFEKVVRWSFADDSPACPACQSPKTTRKITRIAFVGSRKHNRMAG